MKDLFEGLQAAGLTPIVIDENTVWPEPPADSAYAKAYNESRNGANHFIRHPLVRRFQYSDGVGDFADAGCHWMLDIAATELPPHLPVGDLGVLSVTSKDGKADMQLQLSDEAPSVWRRHIDWTDMPTGIWVFFLVNEGERVAMILPKEY